MSWIPLCVVLVAIAACACRSEFDAANDRKIVERSPRVAEQMAPSAPEPATGVVCRATAAAAFFLRPSATDRSIGQRYAQGTVLEVLSSTAEAIQPQQGELLFRVRVVHDRRDGFTFLGVGELDPGCPGSLRRTIAGARTVNACRETCAKPHRAAYDACIADAAVDGGEPDGNAVATCTPEPFKRCMQSACGGYRCCGLGP